MWSNVHKTSWQLTDGLRSGHEDKCHIHQYTARQHC